MVDRSLSSLPPDISHTATMRPLRILLISSGEFSGGKYSLASALRELGCEVVEAESTLRSQRIRGDTHGQVAQGYVDLLGLFP